jgi:glyoxylase I family protein
MRSHAEPGAAALAAATLAVSRIGVHERRLVSAIVRRDPEADANEGRKVRYQVKDVQRSIAFYTQTLGFNVDRQNLPAFGQVSIGDLRLILSGPGASGSRPMPNGGRQEPGGWNRVILEVKDLPAHIRELKDQAVCFRNEMEVGPGGKQIQV